METIILGYLGGFLLLFIYLSTRCFFYVEEGHVAAVSSFGQARRQNSGAVKGYQPGMHNKWPWEVVHPLSLMETSWSLSDENRKLTVMAHDGTVLEVECVVRIRARSEKLEELVFQIRDSQTQIRSFLASSLRNEIANFGVSLPPGDAYIYIRSRRKEFLTQYRKAVESDLAAFGVELLGLDLIDIIPPAELAASLNSVQTAKADAEAWVAKARAIAEQKVYAAKEALEIAKSEAEAVGTGIKVTGEGLRKVQEIGTLSDYVNRRTEELTRKRSKLVVLRQGERI